MLEKYASDKRKQKKYALRMFWCGCVLAYFPTQLFFLRAPLLSKCVSTGVHSKNVPLRILCTVFFINVREGIPEYGVNLE